MIESPYLTTQEAAAYLRCSRSYLEKLRVSGKGPAFRKHGASAYYTVADLDEWSAKQRAHSTSEARGSGEQ